MVMPKILVVEDDESLLLFYEMDLEQAGYQVVTAGNAVEGLEAFATESPDLVVLDIRMPGMDGLDAMARMLDQKPWIPIVLNSAYSSYKDSFLSWGADAYVIKSSDTRELRAKIRQVLEARQARVVFPPTWCRDSEALFIMSPPASGRSLLRIEAC